MNAKLQNCNYFNFSLPICYYFRFSSYIFFSWEQFFSAFSFIIILCFIFDFYIYKLHAARVTIITASRRFLTIKRVVSISGQCAVSSIAASLHSTRLRTLRLIHFVNTTDSIRLNFMKKNIYYTIYRYFSIILFFPNLCAFAAVPFLTAFTRRTAILCDLAI